MMKSEESFPSFFLVSSEFGVYRLFLKLTFKAFRNPLKAAAEGTTSVTKRGRFIAPFSQLFFTSRQWCFQPVQNNNKKKKKKEQGDELCKISFFYLIYGGSPRLRLRSWMLEFPALAFAFHPSSRLSRSYVRARNNLFII